MLELLATLGYLLVATAFVLSVAVVSRAPSGTPPTLGVRGYRRQLARAEQPWFARLEPLLLWLAARLAALPIHAQRARIDQRLQAAGDRYGMTADEWLALAILAALAGLVAGLAIWVGLALSPFFAIALPVLAGFGVLISLEGQAATRRRQVVRSLPMAIDLTALCVSAGMTFAQALAEILSAWPASAADALAEELRLVMRQLNLGQPRRVALDQLARRVGVDDVHDLVTAINQSESKGTPLAEILATQAATMRQRHALAVEQRATQAAMKLMLPLLLLLAATFLVVLAPVVLTAGKWL